MIDTWTRRLGGAWAELLTEHGLDDGCRVVELGPGYSAKIAHGLGAVGFHGGLVLVEPNAEARRYAAGANRHVLPEAVIRVVPNLEDDLGPVDFLVANHLLDDLLLAACVGPTRSDRLFAEMVPGRTCSPEFVVAWRALLGRRDDGLGAPAVVGLVIEAVHRVRPRYLVVNEYPSGRHRESGLTEIHNVSLGVLTALEQALSADPTRITTRPRCANIHWLVSRDRKTSA